MSSVEKNQSTGEIVFSQKWFRRIHIVLAAVLVIDLIILILFNNFAVAPIIRGFAGTTPFYVRLIRSVLIIGLVVLFYVTAAGFLNTTKIEVTRSKVGIINSPLPWFGRGEVPSDRLTAVSVEEIRRGNSALFTVKAELTDATHVVLFRDIADAEQAQSIASDIESFLNIQKT